eukprot:6200121-Amphidinium_carterae.1
MNRAVVPVFSGFERGVPPFLSAVVRGKGPAMELAAGVIVEHRLESDQGENECVPCMGASVPRATLAYEGADGSGHTELPLFGGDMPTMQQST